MPLRKITVIFTAFFIAWGCIVQNGLAFQQTGTTEQDDDPAWTDPTGAQQDWKKRIVSGQRYEKRISIDYITSYETSTVIL